MASMLDDLSLLTSLHRQVVVESGRADLLDITDELEARCRADDPDAPTELVAALDPDTTERIARLLTVHLHLTNLAEERQRARSLRREDGEFGGGTDTGDIGPAVAACGPDARARIERMRIHPVLTAHPTEARRRAVATALRRIADLLDAARRRRSGPLGARPGAAAGCSRRSTSCSAPRPCGITRPDPADEVRTVMTVFDRRCPRRAARSSGPSRARWAAIDPGRGTVPPFVRFGSWVGGDRDGNPYVTAEVTRETVAIQADHVLRALETPRPDRPDAHPRRASRRRRRQALRDAAGQRRRGPPAAARRDRHALPAASRTGRSCSSWPPAARRDPAGDADLAYAGPDEPLADLRWCRTRSSRPAPPGGRTASCST